ncbi:MAG: tryptophan--tRNA ligase [Actinomycetota bacterium]|nr:tryptophan--tRNA ligase [Actinomycetota bacterium]
MKRVLTGYRPTGRLHLGHMVGNLQNMLDLQSKYECHFFVADWHALTTDYADTTKLIDFSYEMVLDWLAFGLDPEKSVIYRQSDVPEVAELALYLGMLTPLAWLERNPTYKEQLVELKNREITTYGFLGYPVLQAADILIVHGDLVPVGEDQLPHLELSREIARRFNSLYGDYLTEPQAILSKGKRMPGTDGRKMSKSYNNAIFLTDEPDEIYRKVQKMVTDPARVRRSDPGHPDVCSVFAVHGIFTAHELKKVETECREAVIGCTDCKKLLAASISEALADFRGRRLDLSERPELAEEVLQDGAGRARRIAAETLGEVRARMHICRTK